MFNPVVNFSTGFSYYVDMLNKAYINLIQLKKNALAIKRKLKKGVKFCAVVKADAYGPGASIVASALYPLVDYFAVALPEEGVSLRQSGIDKPILVLTTLNKEDYEIVVRYNLTATIVSKKEVRGLEREASYQKKKVKVHLKYNTGMNRQGVDSLKELEELVKYILKLKHVEIEGMYSHFANPQNKKDRKDAENKFLLANNLVKRYNNKAICHISASGGFLAGVQADMVRIGILLYGYKPFKSQLVSVSPIMKLYAPVINRRRLSKGESALYGKNPTKEQTEITLIRYGYADGLNRKASGNQFNNRCMDITAVVEESSGKLQYEVLGNADKLAKEQNTISYEILTKVAIRAQKIYIT